MSSSLEAAISRARRAVLDAARCAPPFEPFAAMLVRARRMSGEHADPRPLLHHWHSRARGSPIGPDRYPWELTHARATGVPEYAKTPERWHAWHPSEQVFVEKDRFAFEERLTAPIVSCESCELLAEVADSVDGAADLLRELLPTLRRDFASYVQSRHAWTDTFALWVAAGYERCFTLVHPLLVAIGECYAAMARYSGGRVLGTRFPFHEKPLASASAQLATGLLALGTHVDLIAQLAAFVRDAQRQDGAWADATEPPDVLTTLVAAKLLAEIDPEFSTQSAERYLIEQQEPAGTWRIFGPEVPWLTLSIARWLAVAARPFSQRFRWPRVLNANLDRKTGLPFYAYFLDVAALYSQLPGLASAESPVAFIDLAGFREFNNRFGQDKGDEVLALFAGELSLLGSARAIRDGGDEFIVIGAPTRTDLGKALLSFAERWPGTFANRFGTDIPPVAPRILHAITPGRRLVAAREALGRALGPLKKRAPNPDGRGVVERLAFGG